MKLIEHFSLYDATFKPLKTDDLKEGSEKFIDWRGIWQSLWIIEGGEYQGQYAMGIYDPINQLEEMPSFLWVPECDLEIHERVENYEID